MSQAHELLRLGRKVLVGELGVTFTVDGIPGQFIGRSEGGAFSDKPGEGGFIPIADCMLTVAVSEFAQVDLEPWPGMRINMFGRAWVVARLFQNGLKWDLSLEQGFPKSSD